MGDRAVLTFDKATKPTSVGVYLHWNGDPKTVESILQLCRDRNYRLPGDDPAYAMARLIEACCEVSGPGESTGVGVDTLSKLDTDNGDNGVYVIGGNWAVYAHLEG